MTNADPDLTTAQLWVKIERLIAARDTEIARLQTRLAAAELIIEILRPPKPGALIAAALAVYDAFDNA